MFWYQYLSLGCLLVCLCACTWHFIRLVRLGKPKDLSKKSGNIPRAEVYSYTVSMLPNQKESAYLHIPSFTAGVFFHIGTFIGLLLFVVSFFISPEVLEGFHILNIWLILAWLMLLGLVAGIICGLLLFLKHFFSKTLRALSTLDDYLSCFLTTAFQAFTAIYLVFGDGFAPYYYILVSVLLLYLPVGKLRHVVYFFAARYHLGFFYGWRNSWPPSSIDS